MGLINGSLQIGSTALMTNQALMQIVGNNIANAGNPDYTRQTATLSSISGAKLPDGSSAGAGVQMIGLDRYIDYAVEQRLRSSLSDQNFDLLSSEVLSRLEALHNEMTDTDLSSMLSQFFDAWSKLQSQPGDASARSVVVEMGKMLTEQIQSLRTDIVGFYDELGNALENNIQSVNQLGAQIAELNVEIIARTTNGIQPSELLDQRDSLIKQLSELVDINVVDRDSGMMTIYIGSEPLVDFDHVRSLEVEWESNDELLVPKAVFADDKSDADVTSGKIGATAYIIDDVLTNHLEKLDTFSASLIFEVNRIHAGGQGLHGYSSVLAGYDVDDPAAALNVAGLDFTPQNGTFVITVHDSVTGQDAVHQINVDLNGIGTDMTLNDLASAINAISGLTSSVTTNNLLTIQSSADNYTFTFSEDTSNILACLGINSFFTGTDGSNIEVNAEIIADPELIAASSNNLPGDGSNAELIAGLRDAGVSALAGSSISEYYRSIVGQLGAKVAAADRNYQVHQAITETLIAQRESISGVNLDEETVNLMAAQRAFQGAARYISVVDELLQEIMRMF